MSCSSGPSVQSRWLLPAAVILLYALALLAAAGLPELPEARLDGTTLRYDAEGN